MTLENLFWDSCLFIRYVIGDSTAAHFSDIVRFVDDAKAGKRKIYFSTLTFAEIRQDHFKASPYGDIKEFFDDLGSNFFPVEPNPNVMIGASAIRSAGSTNPSDPNGKGRTVATPDAIILSTCLYVRDAMGVPDVVFYTTDDGKGTNWSGRCIPLLSFERWYPESARTPMISKVCSLMRMPPLHPEPMFEGMVVRLLTKEERP